MPFDQLNVSPLIRALGEQPEDFAIYGDTRRGGTLLHPKSGHTFSIEPGHSVKITAACGCSQVEVSADDSVRVNEAARSWEETYWRSIVNAGAAPAELSRAAHALQVAREHQYRTTAGMLVHVLGGAFYDVNREFAAHFRPTPEQSARIERQRREAETPIAVEAAAWVGEPKLEREKVRASVSNWLKTREPAMAGGDD